MQIGTLLKIIFERVHLVAKFYSVRNLIWSRNNERLGARLSMPCLLLIYFFDIFSVYIFGPFFKFVYFIFMVH